MEQLVLRNLRRDDAHQLLQFELSNRAWFERHVVPRDTAFYTPSGIAAHIRQCEEDFENARWHACVMLNGTGEIIGRANLKDIDLAQGRAETGYRIGEDYTGKGYASIALLHLLELAQKEWKLKRVFAYVSLNNPASARVLEKCGFNKGQRLTDLACVNGIWVDGDEFEYRLTALADQEKRSSGFIDHFEQVCHRRWR